MDERKAISRLKQEDTSGLETLVSEYQVEAVRAAYLIARDRHLAEDIVQTAFLKVYERRRQFDPERPFRPWFLRIVVNDTLKAVARRSREVSLDRNPGDDEVSLADLLPHPNPGPEAVAEHSEVREAVWEALGKLSPAQRKIIVLRYYLGLKETEIAEQSGQALGTVKWLAHAAKERLRTLLSPIFREPVGRYFPPETTNACPEGMIASSEDEDGGAK